MELESWLCWQGTGLCACAVDNVVVVDVDVVALEARECNKGNHK